MVTGPPPEALIVFGIIAVALVLFVSEVIPNDITAIGIIVTLAALGPTIGFETADALSGFSNTATVTIIAMYMLSAGIQKTGLVKRLGVHLVHLTRGDERRTLAATVGTTAPLAGFINNTPIVAIFIPMITNLAEKNGISPSKLLLPLSYAAILGGTLTLIGTSSNLLASDLAGELIAGRERLGMFEFSALSLVILVVGLTYLLTVGYRLVPARIPAQQDLIEQFELYDQLTYMTVQAEGRAVGERPTALMEAASERLTVLQVRRGGTVLSVPGTDPPLQAGDRLVVHAGTEAIDRFARSFDLRRVSGPQISESTFNDVSTDKLLVKAVVPKESDYISQRLAATGLRDHHQVTTLAIRREGTLLLTDLDATTLRPGDVLLTRMPAGATEYFAKNGDLVVVDDHAYNQLLERPPEEVVPLSAKAPLAVGILAGVVALVTFNVVSVAIAALGGVAAMVVTGCLRPGEAYQAVSWNIIFLLAGVIPLGRAMEQTAGAAFIADVLTATAEVLPLLAVLLLFYLLTGLLANVITPVATVVLMIPVAVDAASTLGANEFAFLLAVMFSSATSFMTPVGYQTNLMVYGPGGYEFTDFLRVGAPLQVLLAGVTTVGIALIWPL